MKTQHFPDLDANAIAATRDALHSYAQIMGGWLKTCRPRRKHWWHASLRSSLTGLTTGVIHADAKSKASVDLELELNLRESLLLGRSSEGGQLREELHGQAPSDVAATVRDFMLSSGIDSRYIPDGVEFEEQASAPYSPIHAAEMGRALNAVSASLEILRAGIAEESSPIQLWPHHFDLSMLWLPGEKIPGQDPENEEYSDKQMNFGFTFGDNAIREPYFYITAYPLPDGLANLNLPADTVWHTEGFSGALLLYRDLVKQDRPQDHLIGLWRQMLQAGHSRMLGDLA